MRAIESADTRQRVAAHGEIATVENRADAERVVDERSASAAPRACRTRESARGPSSPSRRTGTGR